jgi:hypothetical protein
MSKEQLIDIVNEILKLNGFEWKGNSWKFETEELIKVVTLQKSFFRNQYFLNYGFNLKKLENNPVEMHIFRTLPMSDLQERNLLDFDEKIHEKKRWKQIKSFLNKLLSTELNIINTTSQLIENIRHQSYFNEIPKKVKDFLGF